jgi:hypothetical protein
MLDATTMIDPTLQPGGQTRGQDPDHRQSPRGDLTSSLSLSPDEHGQGQGREDLWDVLHTRDVWQCIGEVNSPASERPLKPSCLSYTTTSPCSR